MTGRGDVVIIGAPRSGTNMLRDVLTQLPEFVTWPCDEINPVWRHGNRSHPSDELTRAEARPEVQAFIRGRFADLRGSGDARVVEKTCANSVRVEFVAEVIPAAHYVFIHRDGLDVAPSAVQRWHAPLDLRYTAAKARYVPPSDVPYYAWRFLRSRLRRADETGGSTDWWGPRLDDSATIVREHPLDEVAMIQWARCVRASLDGLRSVPATRVHRIGYEDFVADPVAGVSDLLAFLEVDRDVDPAWVADVSPYSVGKGRGAMGVEQRERLTALGVAELEELGYDAS